MRLFLLPWLDHILEHGMVGAFSIPFSNYTPPYLYLMALVSPLAAVVSKISLVKSLSIAGTLVLAAAVRQLLRSTGRKFSVETLLCLMLLPSVAINAVGFGQCDAIWSAACVMAVASAVCRRPLGDADLVRRRCIVQGAGNLPRPVRRAAIAAGAGAAAAVADSRAGLRGGAVPAALAGWPVDQLATVDFHQAEWNPAFVSTATNPWSLVEYWSSAQAHHWFWLGYAAAAVAGIQPRPRLPPPRQRRCCRHDLARLALGLHPSLPAAENARALLLPGRRPGLRPGGRPAGLAVNADPGLRPMRVDAGNRRGDAEGPALPGHRDTHDARCDAAGDRRTLARVLYARAPCPWEPARGTASPFTSERARIRAF